MSTPSDRIARRWTIGDALLEGPRHLFLGDPEGVEGWLEAQLKIYWNSRDLREFRSTIIFCDENGDEESGFPPPAVLFCTWNRWADRQDHPCWPTASVEVRRILDVEAVQLLVKRLQAAFLEIGFIPCGLNTRRDYPEWDASEGELRLYLEMGLQDCASRGQHIELSVPVAHAHPVWDAVCAREETTRQASVALPRGSYAEEYDCNLDELYPLKSWKWDGEVPAPPTG